MAEAGLDVAIVGAGPVGCALALGLQESGLQVALVERPRDPVATGQVGGAVRAIALSYASRLILERFAAWHALQTTPIDTIHVSQRGGFGQTRISSADVGLPALGYVTAYDRIAPQFALCLRPGAIERIEATSPPAARLVVHAEGTAGTHAIERRYGQTAIVALISCDRPVDGIAWERFTDEGPLALLPLGHDYALVWSMSDAAAGETLALDESGFLRELQKAFGMRAGRFIAAGERAATPLLLRYRAARPASGEVHIGNAAQTLHPVAGQGLNLGLRDAWDLTELLRRTPRERLGSPAVAAEFARSRRIDARGTIHATDLLATLFVRRDPLSAALRGAALAGFDLVPAARRTLARAMIFGPGIG